MRRIARGFLLAVSAINGVLGVVCAVLLLLKPDGRLLGMQVLLPVIAEFPWSDIFFRDFLWIGIVMLLGLGLPNLLAFAMLLRRVPMQYRFTLIAAVLLLLWCGFELVYMFNIAVVAFFAVAVLSIAASIWLMQPAGHDRDEVVS